MAVHELDDDTHYCRKCNPSMFPSDSFRSRPSGEDHVAARLNSPHLKHLEVYLGGELLDMVLEARAGRGAGKPGWAILAWRDADGSVAEHICPGMFNGPFCEKVVVGQVELRYV